MPCDVTNSVLATRFLKAAGATSRECARVSDLQSKKESKVSWNVRVIIISFLVFSDCAFVMNGACVVAAVFRVFAHSPVPHYALLGLILAIIEELLCSRGIRRVLFSGWL